MIILLRKTIYGKVETTTQKAKKDVEKTRKEKGLNFREYRAAIFFIHFPKS